MQRTREEEDWYDHDDPDGPLASDRSGRGAGSDDFDIVPCPYCGKAISDLAEVCPKCGSFIARADLLTSHRPPWVTAVTVVLLIALSVGLVSFR